MVPARVQAGSGIARAISPVEAIAPFIPAPFTPQALLKPGNALLAEAALQLRRVEYASGATPAADGDQPVQRGEVRKHNASTKRLPFLGGQRSQLVPRQDAAVIHKRTKRELRSGVKPKEALGWPVHSLTSKAKF